MEAAAMVSMASGLATVARAGGLTVAAELMRLPAIVAGVPKGVITATANFLHCGGGKLGCPRPPY